MLGETEGTWRAAFPFCVENDERGAALDPLSKDRPSSERAESLNPLPTCHLEAPPDGSTSCNANAPDRAERSLETGLLLMQLYLASRLVLLRLCLKNPLGFFPLQSSFRGQVLASPIDEVLDHANTGTDALWPYFRFSRHLRNRLCVLGREIFRWMSGIGVGICYPLFHGDILEGCLDERPVRQIRIRHNQDDRIYTCWHLGFQTARSGRYSSFSLRLTRQYRGLLYICMLGEHID